MNKAQQQLVRARFGTPAQSERDKIIDDAASILAQIKSSSEQDLVDELTTTLYDTDDTDQTAITSHSDVTEDTESDIEGPLSFISNNKTAVFTLGRYQPMHQGHLSVIDTVIKIAEIKKNADAYVFISNTGGQDNKNLLIASEKLEIAERTIGEMRNIHIDIKNMGDAIHTFINDHYKNIILVIGCDRYKGFQKMITGMLKLHPDIKLYIVVLPREGQETTDCPEGQKPHILYSDKGEETSVDLDGVVMKSDVKGMSGTAIRKEAEEIREKLDRLNEEIPVIDKEISDSAIGLLALSIYGQSKIEFETLKALMDAMNPLRRRRLIEIFNKHKKTKKPEKLSPKELQDKLTQEVNSWVFSGGEKSKMQRLKTRRRSKMQRLKSRRKSKTRRKTTTRRKPKMRRKLKTRKTH